MLKGSERSAGPEESRAARVANFWDARAARYDGHYDTVGPDGYSLTARLALTLRLIGSGPGTVLDVGMGAGRLCESLARAGWTVSGIDVSGEMVALARRRLPDAEERLFCASAERLPFPDGSFDAVTATGALEYTDVPRALAELARVLRPGGLAIVSYPNSSAFYSLWKTRAWYPLLELARQSLGRSRPVAPKGGPSLSQASFTQELKAAGLEIGSVQYTGYLLLPAPLDDVFSGLTAFLGRKLEGSGERVSRVLATQVLYPSRKPNSKQHQSAPPTNDVKERAYR